MADGWQWDETLFQGAAEFYERGRLPYAPRLADAFAQATIADGTGRLLDVGCGPGSIALRLAGHYREVVGVDPDPGMIAEAQRLAAERDATNTSFIQARGEDLPLGLGQFDAIVFASSFHWMNRELVAGVVGTMLTPSGVVVQVDTDRTRPPDTDLPHPKPPNDAIGKLVKKYLGEQRRAGRTVGFVSPSNEDAVWSAAGYVGLENVRVLDGRILDRSIDDVIAGTLSMSSSAPHLFGEQLPAFVDDLRALLRQISPSGHFSVVLADTVLKIWRLCC